jgi:hypothetical protein
LIDDPDFKAKLQKEYPEAIGGEMEAAGAYAAAEFDKRDWIVVKAVCDYADGNKGENKQENQEIAAQNAAKLVFHVLEQGKFGSISIRSKREDKGKEKKSSSRAAIKKRVKENIIELLDKTNMECFCHALKCLLNKENKGNKQYKIDQMAAILVEMDVLDAVLILDQSVEECFRIIDKTAGTVDLINSTWDAGVSILGWLALLAVDDRWVQNTSQRVAESGKSLDLVIPVTTEIGEETAFSRLKEVKANFNGVRDNRDVAAGKKIPLENWGIEVGWNIKDKISTIKMMLWKQLGPPDPAGGNPKDEEYITRYLRQTFKVREKRGEPFYIAVNLSDNDNPLLEEEVCKYLIDDLGLNIFLIGSTEDRVAIIIEPELNAQLVEFFRNNPNKEGK